jgi:hypothetical protein
MDQEQKTSEVRRDEVVNGGTSVQRQQVTTENTADGRVVAQRIIWYIAGFIISLLALRVVMLMLGANRDAPFVDFIYGISGIFAAPFYGIFPSPEYNGQFYLDSASFVAIAVYALLAWGIARLFTITSSRTSV